MTPQYDASEFQLQFLEEFDGDAERGRYLLIRVPAGNQLLDFCRVRIRKLAVLPALFLGRLLGGLPRLHPDGDAALLTLVGSSIKLLPCVLPFGCLGFLVLGVLSEWLHVFPRFDSGQRQLAV